MCQLSIFTSVVLCCGLILTQNVLKDRLFDKNLLKADYEMNLVGIIGS